MMAAAKFLTILHPLAATLIPRTLSEIPFTSALRGVTVTSVRWRYGFFLPRCDGCSGEPEEQLVPFAYGWSARHCRSFRTDSPTRSLPAAVSDAGHRRQNVRLRSAANGYTASPTKNDVLSWTRIEASGQRPFRQACSIITPPDPIAPPDPSLPNITRESSLE
jgi:hypothetical protein